jgi:hypothetical protein
MPYLYPPSEKVWRVLYSLLFFLVAGCGNAIAEPATPAKTHQLPDNPDTPIIYLDYKGGLKPRLPNNPHLLIKASGEGFLGSPYGVSKPVNFQVSQDEIQDVLRFIIDENSFFNFDSAIVKTKVSDELSRPITDNDKKVKSVFAVADAPTLEIRIQADGKHHTVEYYALSFAARQFPDIPELQQMLAIAKRLQHLMSVKRIGGEEVLMPYIDQANILIQKKWPGTPLLNPIDLEHTTLLKNGEMRIRFKINNKQLSDETVRAVEVVELPGKPPKYHLFDQ